MELKKPSRTDQIFDRGYEEIGVGGLEDSR